MDLLKNGMSTVQTVLACTLVSVAKYIEVIVRSEYIWSSEHQKVYFTSGAVTSEIKTFGVHEMKYIKLVSSTVHADISLKQRKGPKFETVKLPNW
jgi:hypothetical protein